MSESFSPLINELINALRCLPSVGPKSAQRMAFHLLQQHREEGKQLAHCLIESMDNIKHCSRCRILCETEVCKICDHPKRNHAMVCIVESPADVLAIEQMGHFRGVYFVLMGHLSPIDGIGPQELGLDILEARFAEAEIKEIILATNSTVEGQATAYYITEMADVYKITTSRIAQGIPIGGELEYVDSSTLAHAFMERKTIIKQ